MAFQDYSTNPAANTTVGDATFIGPNMPRDNVRPALQQLAADGRTLYNQYATGIGDAVAEAAELATTNGAVQVALATAQVELATALTTALVTYTFGYIGIDDPLPPEGVEDGEGYVYTQDGRVFGAINDGGTGEVKFEILTAATFGPVGVFEVPVSVTNPFTLTSLGPTVPKGVFFGANNSLSFQTVISSPSGSADSDNQRGSLLISADTQDDGNSEENTFCVLTRVVTGKTVPWAQSTAYALGANVYVLANNAVYRCVQAGTSAASGSGPTGTGLAITDGTCIWNWINAKAIDGKVGIYNETVAYSTGGNAWGQANNLELEPGYGGTFATAMECDLTNNSGTDSVFGGVNYNNLYVFTKGANRSTASIEVVTTNTGSDPHAAIWGMHFSGPKLAQNAVISIDSPAPVGIGFGNGAGAGGAAAVAFSTATMVDSSTSPKGIVLAGTYSGIGLEVSGSAAAGISLGGTFSGWLIYSPNFQVFPSGSAIMGGGLTIKPDATAVPASNGQMVFELTSNTQLKIKVKGSDGVVRSASLTLA